MIANIHKQFIARFYYLNLCPKAQKLTYYKHRLKDTKITVMREICGSKYKILLRIAWWIFSCT